MSMDGYMHTGLFLLQALARICELKQIYYFRFAPESKTWYIPIWRYLKTMKPQSLKPWMLVVILTVLTQKGSLVCLELLLCFPIQSNTTKKSHRNSLPYNNPAGPRRLRWSLCCWQLIKTSVSIPACFSKNTISSKQKWKSSPQDLFERLEEQMSWRRCLWWRSTVASFHVL